MTNDELVKSLSGRYPGEACPGMLESGDRGPEAVEFPWIPAFAGMTERANFDILGGYRFMIRNRCSESNIRILFKERVRLNDGSFVA